MANLMGGLTSLLTGAGSRTDSLSRLLAPAAAQTAQTVGGEAAGAGVAVDAITRNSSGLEQLTSALTAQALSLATNSKALADNTAAKASGGSPVANAAKSVAGSLFGGLTLSPLVRGIMSLFGGGGSEETQQTVLPKYAAPASVSLLGGLTSGGRQMSGADYDQTGGIRAAAAAAPPPQITVQVQAMDSQSFLDRSDDIARAVKKAMLESASLNDVIREL